MLLKENINIALRDFFSEKGTRRDILDTGRKNIRREDFGYFSLVFLGVIENVILLDRVTAKFSKIKLKKYRDIELNLLRITVFEILFTERASYASINETVEIMKRINKRLSPVFNGILRNIDRQKDTVISDVLDNLGDLERMSVKYSASPAFTRFISDKLGDDKAREYLEASSRKPKLMIRVNTLKTDSDKLKDSLESDGFVLRSAAFADDAFEIIRTGDVSIDSTKAFQMGWFIVQGEASMLAGSLFEGENPAEILDMCAAPGGKATHLAAMFSEKATVYACDKSKDKTDKITENVNRLGLENVNVMISDAEALREDFLLRFDAILLDAPCSALGTISKNPEIKYMKDIESIKGLPNVQYRMLLNAARYIKPGGLIVYSTCTFNIEENEDIVEKFLSENKGFSREKIKLNDSLTSNGYLKTMPGKHGMDGLFACKIRKEKDTGEI